MPGFLSTLRSLFLGRDDAPEAVRRPQAGRIDASALPVPADSQEIVTMAREFRAFLDLQDQRQQYLARVLERNRAGELVVGSVIAAAPTEVPEGEALEAGDVVQVAAEGEAPADARGDGGAGPGPVEPGAAGARVVRDG